MDTEESYAHWYAWLGVLFLLIAGWCLVGERNPYSRWPDQASTDYTSLKEEALRWAKPQLKEEIGFAQQAGFYSASNPWWRAGRMPRKKKVQFTDLNYGPHQAYTSPHFLDGPEKVVAQVDPSPTPAMGEISPGRYQAERMSLVLDRMAESTRRTYDSQYRWWELFCQRRGISPLRTVLAPNPREEELVLDFIIHSGVIMQKSPGTVKLRIAAIRSKHLSLGLPDPLYYMPRVPLALSGLKRRWGTPERRLPVTPEMLRWLKAQLQPDRFAADALLWAAVCLGFFFLLRASEFLEVGYRLPHRGLFGRHAVLQRNGKPVSLSELAQADELVLTVQSSKTDIFNKGETRNHFRVPRIKGEDAPLCVVEAVCMLFHHFPGRMPGNTDQDLPLLTELNGKLMTREAVQTALQLAARALGFNAERLGSHSLRFGGASALWAAYHDSGLVRRWGRWASDCFQSYIWEGRKGAQGVARSMGRADLTPN